MAQRCDCQNLGEVTLFFTKIGSFLAWALVVLGALRFAMGLYVAITFESNESMVAASKRYLATANSGEAITEGILMFGVGIVIGLVAQIAKNTRLP